jgi:hypothetical protein
MKHQRTIELIAVHIAPMAGAPHLAAHAQDRILRASSLYLGQVRAASVQFQQEGRSSRCLLNVQVGALPPVAAEALHCDGHRAFDLALSAATKRLRLLKRELRRRRGGLIVSTPFHPGEWQRGKSPSRRGPNGLKSAEGFRGTRVTGPPHERLRQRDEPCLIPRDFGLALWDALPFEAD